MRISLAETLGNRTATTDTEARVLNGYAELDGKLIRAYKRPGLVSSYTVTTGAASSTPTLGQGLFAWTGPNAPGVPGTSTLAAVRGDSLFSGI